ncbi:methyl-accepting chemotaxis protein [Actinomycetes bacterium NPDC127524]
MMITTLKTDHEILQSLVDSAAFFQSAAKEDIAISICDREKWLLQLDHQNIKLGIKAGDPVSKEDEVIQSALSGNKGAGRPPLEVYGIHFFGKTTPIFNGNRIIGAMGMAYNIDIILKLEDCIEKLNSITRRIKKLITSIVAQAGDLSDTNSQLYSFSEKARENSENIDSILKVIQQISRQSNILGLNANIEAARAGEAGKGFKIVAEEIRKISKETENSSGEINEFIQVVKDNINEITEGVSQIRQLNSMQSALIGDVASTLESLSDIIEMLSEYIKILG